MMTVRRSCWATVLPVWIWRRLGAIRAWHGRDCDPGFLLITRGCVQCCSWAAEAARCFMVMLCSTIEKTSVMSNETKLPASQMRTP